MRVSFVPFLQTSGSLLIAYGIIREAFGGGIPQRPAEAHAGPSSVTEVLAQAQEIALNIGGKLGLIPTQHVLNAMERRLDAELAIVGFLFLVIAAVIGAVMRLRGH